MDMQKIGAFLAQLRKERGMTQEQLGEKLGVSNKTVSRWETGTYLPPVEMLQTLSDFYGITINEILAAQTLSQEQFREKAEENVKTALKNSTFGLNEKIAFFQRKWDKEHFVGNALGMLLALALIVVGSVCDNGWQLVGTVFGFSWLLVRQNQRKSYVEQRAFDGSGQQ